LIAELLSIALMPVGDSCQEFCRIDVIAKAAEPLVSSMDEQFPRMLIRGAIQLISMLWNRLGGFTLTMAE